MKEEEEEEEEKTMLKNKNIHFSFVI